MRSVSLAALVLALASPAHGHWASSRRGQNRRLTGVSVAETVPGISAAQCQLVCLQRGDCRSFNHHRVDAVCEIFTVTVCDHHSYYITSTDGWIWYDVVSDPSQESKSQLWTDSICTDGGRCRDDICLRRLDEPCREHNQCRYHVTGGTQCSSSQCVCDSASWKYNTTLCEKTNIELTTDGEHWVFKELVNGICSMEFDAQATDDLRFVLTESNTHYSNRYHFRIGYNGNSATYAERIQEGVRSDTFASYSGDLLDGNNYRRYGLHWCSGQIRFYRPGIDTYISWDDPERFSPGYIGISTALQGRWRFTKDMVDLWMGDWSDDRVYTIPRYSTLFRRATEQTFSVTFDCRASNDCNWLASDTVIWDHSHMYSIVIGGWGNQYSRVQRHTPGVGWATLASKKMSGIVSRSELRKFRIRFEPGRIRVYRASRPNAFLDATDPSPITINFHGPRSCCDSAGMDVRLVRYDRSWSYEAGYRWAEDLQ
ncbi:uncharacterized protein LOC119091628 [Pollicipes pollicipes]|uniref:uncharacterized protein LOC119091628 n=1 Tax=Pollicipes pollicipes TaxID=41117 RepID=UPI001885071F|nr:uncharacterized protein LOC119091628 [Pollicipes pollicipes]